jgi:hypothetical protein
VLTCSLTLAGWHVSAAVWQMRSKYIPEDCRSTVMNFFRMPLNLFVCVVRASLQYTPPSWARLVWRFPKSGVKWSLLGIREAGRKNHMKRALSLFTERSKEWLVLAGTVQRV